MLTFNHYLYFSQPFIWGHNGGGGTGSTGGNVCLIRKAPAIIICRGFRKVNPMGFKPMTFRTGI